MLLLHHTPEARHHRPIDFWVLLLLWQQGGMPGGGGGPAGGATGGGAAAQHARAAEASLRRKILEGHAGGRWMEAAIRDHQVRGGAVRARFARLLLIQFTRQTVPADFTIVHALLKLGPLIILTVIHC